jgi:hypothetical protein
MTGRQKIAGATRPVISVAVPPHSSEHHVSWMLMILLLTVDNLVNKTSVSAGNPVDRTAPPFALKSTTPVKCASMTAVSARQVSQCPTLCRVPPYLRHVSWMLADSALSIVDNLGMF